MDTLVNATVKAMKYFEQYSLENDQDRMAYQEFTSFSPKEGARIRGYLFELYGKRIK
jgi:hypothetical protein